MSIFIYKHIKKWNIIFILFPIFFRKTLKKLLLDLWVVCRKNIIWQICKRGSFLCVEDVMDCLKAFFNGVWAFFLYPRGRPFSTTSFIQQSPIWFNCLVRFIIEATVGSRWVDLLRFWKKLVILWLLKTRELNS